MNEKVSLFFCEGNSDKEYHVQLEQLGPRYVVNFQYGRRGSSLTSGTKTKVAVPYDMAKKIYDYLLSHQIRKGYQAQASTNTTYQSAAPVSVPDVVSMNRKIILDVSERCVPQLLNPITDEEVEQYLRDDAYGAQEKKDGRHQMIKSGSSVTVYNKKGKEIGYPKAWAKDLREQSVLLDGEAIGEVFHVFDLLQVSGHDLKTSGYKTRHDRLSKLKFGSSIVIVPLAIGYKAKKALYDRLFSEGKEGIVFKKLDAVHKPGRPASGGDMLKKKFLSSVSVRVCAGRENKRSIGMEILNGNVWEFVGNCTIPPNKAVPVVGDIVEIIYLYVDGIGGHLYQPVYKEVRDDVEALECVIAQLKYKAED